MTNLPGSLRSKSQRLGNGTPDSKVQPETNWKALLASIKDTLSLLRDIAFLVGVVCVFSYLIGNANFFPVGLTIGETLFFLLVAFAFGIAYAILVGIGFVFFIGLSNSLTRLKYVAGMSIRKKFINKRDLNKKFQNKWKTFPIWIVASILFLVTWWLGIQVKTVMLVIAPIVAFTFCGFGLYQVIKKLERNNFLKRKGLKPSHNTNFFILYSIILILLVPTLMSAQFMENLIRKVVMANIGIYTEDATLRLSEENYQILETVSLNSGTPILGCPEKNLNYRLVHGVTVLWHGIGERSLVRLPSKSSGVVGPSVELKRDGVSVVRDFSGPPLRCFEVSSDLLFQVGTDTPASDFKNTLQNVKQQIDSFGNQIDTIEVIGHSDPLNVTRPGDSNLKLSERRAERIKIALEALGVKNVKSIGKGAHEPKTLCKDWPIQNSISDCFAPNRRVEFRLRLNALPIQIGT